MANIFGLVLSEDHWICWKEPVSISQSDGFMKRHTNRIFCTRDARRLAQRRLPRMIFDFIDGASGREMGVMRNEEEITNTLLYPRVMADVENRSLATQFLGQRYDVPFGIAPMGMCNLACPNADQHLANAAKTMNMPVCLSSAGSSLMTDMIKWAGENAWFQLYFGHSAEASLAMAAKAKEAGFKSLVLTVDVPQVSRRVRDLRNGFNVPFKMTPRAFVDFALHPHWSLSTLAAGIPSPQNFGYSDTTNGFDRRASRAGAEWEFMKKLREQWSGHLIVKGVTHPEDAKRIESLGADAIYVSNHGARQLDSAIPAIRALPLIRKAVKPDFPLIFDSGLRSGEDVVKALALGADFAMIGRPALFALGAQGRLGLTSLLESIVEDISTTMAQLGVRTIDDLDSRVLVEHARSAIGCEKG
jgi:L-lactate dehydrogenase (cytochrome)